MFKRLKIAMGIITRCVFTGPLEAAIDITNRCNLGCITCWFYSPLKGDKVSNDWAKRQMSFELFRRLVDELKEMDVKKVMLGGDGDPFMHPRIIEMLEYAKKAEFIVDTTTCGVFFSEDNLRRMFDSGIDGLNISTLAATPRTYLAMHPTQKWGAFEKITRSLLLLSKLKRQEKQKLPRIRLVNVICNSNYFEVDKMIDFAAEVGADEVAFKRLAIMPFTESLLLNEDQVKELDKKLKTASGRAKLFDITTNIEQFRRQTLHGLTSGDYTLKLYSQIPCYIGWIYARILCDGSLVPCCGCYSYKIGNLRDRTFKEIWHSKEYKDFREKTINILKDASIAQQCACHSCVHSGMNAGIHRRLHFLNKGPNA